MNLFIFDKLNEILSGSKLISSPTPCAGVGVYEAIQGRPAGLLSTAPPLPAQAAGAAGDRGVGASTAGQIIIT